MPATAPARTVAAASIDDLRNVSAGDESLSTVPYNISVTVIELVPAQRSGLCAGDVVFAVVHVRSLHTASALCAGAPARGETLSFAFRGAAIEACCREDTPVGIEVRRAARDGQPEVVFGACVVQAADMVVQSEDEYVDERYTLLRGGFSVGTLRVRSKGRARSPSDAYTGIPSALAPLHPPPGIIFSQQPLPLPRSLPPGVYNL